MILDVCHGKGMMYRGNHKHLSSFVSMDRRIGSFVLPDSVLDWGYRSTEFKISPNMAADLKCLPFRNNTFKLIIFDPPHYKMGKNSIFNIKYGSWGKEELIRSLHYANTEFHRVLEPNGFLLAKILDIHHRRKQVTRYFTNFQLLLSIQQHPTPTGGGINKTKQNRVYWLLFVGCETVVSPQREGKL